MVKGARHGVQKNMVGLMADSNEVTTNVALLAWCWNVRTKKRKQSGKFHLAFRDRVSNCVKEFSLFSNKNVESAFQKIVIL